MSSDPRLPEEPCRTGSGLEFPAAEGVPVNRPFTPWPGQDENGVDLTLIRENLRLTPIDRARKAERLRRMVLRTHELARVKPVKPA